MPRDPFEELAERMEDAFRDIGRQLPGLDAGHIPVDVEERDDEIVVRADLPGVEEDRIDLTVDVDTVRIAASDDMEVAEEGETYVRRERSTRSFRRAVALPAPVDPDTAEASYENGVLTVRVEKTVEGGARDVDIT